MVSKSSAVRSVRLPNDLWARLAEEAGVRGVALNGLICDLLEVALLRAAERDTPLIQELRAMAAAPARVVRLVDDEAPAFVPLTGSSVAEDSKWSDEDVAAMTAKPLKPLALNTVPTKPEPFTTRLKGEWSPAGGGGKRKP